MELDSLESISDFTVLQHAQHLNGVIHETMRLHPATLTGNIRETPPEGAMISGKFVPGKIVICSPRYIIGKRQYSLPTPDKIKYQYNETPKLTEWCLKLVESCFEKPKDFIPERWYSKPEMIKNKDAYAPFALGLPPLFLLAFPDRELTRKLI